MSRHTITPAVEISGLRFAWRGAQDSILSIDRLLIIRGERVFIAGPSGSGKSTLLNLMAGVITPQAGCIVINGVHLSALSGAGRDRFRADHIGFIYQMFNLIPYLSVIENVTLPCRFSPARRRKAAGDDFGPGGQAVRLLEKLGLSGADVIDRPVTELSVGQQQRVAAARAMIGSPELIIADEPTSSLDFSQREAFIRLLFNECDREKTTLVFVSHDLSLQHLFDRTIQVRDFNCSAAPGR
jgi:putative ABC transport system ATP-binding protein